MCTCGPIFSNWSTTNLVVVVVAMLVFLGVLSYIRKVQFFDEAIPAGDRFMVIVVRGMAVKVKERGGV